MVRAIVTLENDKGLTVRDASAYLVMNEAYKYQHRGSKGHTYTYTPKAELEVPVIVPPHRGSRPRPMNTGRIDLRYGCVSS